MKSKLIKTISVTAMAVMLFVSGTAFAAVPEAGIKAPHVSVCNAGHGYYPCGTYTKTTRTKWSDSYYWDTSSLGLSWYTTYERYRMVYVTCADCGGPVGCYTEYQHKTYALDLIPTGGWKDYNY